MNKLPQERQIRILNALVEGASLRAASRMADVSINTVTKLLVDAGSACLKYQSETLRNLTCKRIQCDEIWSFVYAKDKNVPKKLRCKFGFGDVWTWTAIDADTKLIPCWYIGTRDASAAYHFMRDLAGRLANRVQLTTDGHKAYLKRSFRESLASETFGRGLRWTPTQSSCRVGMWAEGTQNQRRPSCGI